jgi:hypothetical protein
VGNHSVKAPLDIGIPDAGANAPPVLDISALGWTEPRRPHRRSKETPALPPRF